MPAMKRPSFHFTPPSGWTNDPNGTLYHGGEYHLFYQHHPDSLQWGPMHWGHAVSRDLVRWEHLPIALHPDELGLIFSGSAVVDERNTSGLGAAGKPPMVAVFTHHGEDGERQSVAYSLDRGRTFAKYARNPVIEEPGARDFRDPKVFWHAASAGWVMVVSFGDRLRIYRSEDLLKWNLASEFGPIEALGPVVLECPDLFELPCGGGARWVLTYSLFETVPGGGHFVQYMTGAFDGSAFTADAGPLPADAGWDFYAPVTFGQAPGRTVWIGWMADPAYAGEVPAEGWNGRMTLPRELGLARVAGKPVLTQRPAREFMSLARDTAAAYHGLKLPAKEQMKFNDCGNAFVVEGMLSKQSKALRIELFGCVTLTIDAAAGTAILAREAEGSLFRHPAFTGERRCALPEKDADVDFLIAADGNCLEAFLQGGALTLSALAFPETGRGSFTVTALGDCVLEKLEVRRLPG